MELTVNTKGNMLTASELDRLGAEAEMYELNGKVSFYNLARIFVQVKENTEHGQWTAWLKQHSGFGERQAQNMMAAYRRFGENPELNGVGQSKLFRLLPLPEGAEEDFLKTHDVESMTTREIEKAVKEAREELEKEKAARREAERRAKLAEEHPVIPQKLLDELQETKATVDRQKDEAERLRNTAQEAVDERLRLQREIVALKKEVSENNELLVEQQKELQRAQEELLNAQSATAKGDAERVPADRLTADALGTAVRAFIGTAARMPHMRKAFAAMESDEWNEYDELLSTMEKWAKDSRKALDAREAVMV